jgi:hypothetical protein
MFRVAADTPITVQKALNRAGTTAGNKTASGGVFWEIWSDAVG